MQNDDRRLHSPAAERNRGPILEALRGLLPERGRALEVASGTGEHVAYFAAALPGFSWQPSDADARSLPSIAAWTEGLPNVRPPLLLSAQPSVQPSVQPSTSGEPWDAGPFDLIYCANMIHIAPWSACVGLMRGAGRALAPTGLLVTYGPYRIGGSHTSASNEAFDADLKRRDPEWGVRDIEAVAEQAKSQGLELRAQLQMPANNLLLAFGRTAG